MRYGILLRGVRRVLLMVGILGLCVSASRFLPSAARASGVRLEKPENFHDIATLTTSIDDLQATVHVAQVDMKELEKIGRDFSTTYRIRTLEMRYKKPDKIRLSGHIAPFGEAVMIVNGSTRYYHVPKLPKRVEDLTNAPGRRLSLLEYGGLVAPDTLRFMQGRFVREDKLDSHDALVFDMNYIGSTASLHYRVWIDPQTHITNKREWLDGDNKLRATFFYKEPREIRPGIWLPSRIEVQNAEGVTAAVTTIDNVKVDQGLSDDLFVIEP